MRERLDIMPGPSSGMISPVANEVGVHPPDRRGREIPWWLLAAALLAVLVFWLISVDAEYRVIFAALSKGIVVTLWVTAVAFALAAMLGLIVALGRLSR